MDWLKFFALSTLIFVLITSLLLLPFLKSETPELIVTVLTIIIAIMFAVYLIISIRKEASKEAS
ncbi:MAG: hypothetical protein QW794_04670 [Thermosphaera sp.]